MLSLSYFKGCTIGFAAAAPIGGISILCMRRTFAEGWLCGVVSALGVATADGFYSFIAIVAAELIVPILEQYHHWLRVLAGVLLCGMACKIALTSPTIQLAPVQGRKLLDRFGSMFALTLADPVPIFLMIVILSGIKSANHSFHAGMLSFGVFSGSMLWWLLLCSTCELLRSRLKRTDRGTRSIFHPAAINWLNRVAGAVLFGFGLIVLSG